MQYPEMILFDWGDTLIHRKALNAAKGITEVLRRAAYIPEGVTPERVYALARQLRKELEADEKTGFETHIQYHSRQLSRTVYSILGVKFDISLDEVEGIYCAYADELDPTLHIEALLEALDRMGIRTAVISNLMLSSEHLLRAVNDILPTNKFEFCISSADYGFQKPGTRIFEATLGRAGVPASKAWYCGNLSGVDVEGAHNAGLLPVWYKGATWGEKDFAPAYEVLEVLDWLEMISRLEELAASRV